MNKFYIGLLLLCVGCKPIEPVVTVAPEIKVRLAQQDIADFSDGGSVRVVAVYPKQSLRTEEGTIDGLRAVKGVWLIDDFYAVVESRGMTEGERMVVPFEVNEAVVVGDLWKLKATENGVRFGERITE